MSQSGEVTCCYKQSLDDSSSHVICHRLLELADLSGENWGWVGLDACRVCKGTSQRDKKFYNDVLASLLFQLGRKIVAQNGTTECSVERANSLIQFAHGGLRAVHRPQIHHAKRPKGNSSGRPRVNCDVVINFTKPAENFAGALTGIVNQQDCDLSIHLVTLPDFQHPLWDELKTLPQIQQHKVPTAVTDLQAVHAVLSNCSTDFIAVQSANSISHLSRISDAVNELLNLEGELFGSGIMEHGKLIAALTPLDKFQRTVPVETLVFRRTTYIDMEGVGDVAYKDDVDFVYRCYRENRKLILSDQCTAARVTNRVDETNPASPAVPQNGFSLNQRVSCDVILPFRDHLNFVEEAIESILAQVNCDIVLHLVDDDSRNPVDSFLRRWNQLSNIRCYQNRINLGQYTSFNNIIPYVETDFIAIQDGDDLSMPTRISDSVNRLQAAKADVFTGAMQVFGATQERASSTKNGNAIMRSVAPGMMKFPTFPNRKKVHFAFNGSVVMRVSTFQELGGFTDYGSSERNRAGLDTEFYLRAYHSRNTKFFISRKLVLRCRRHADSATQTDSTGFGSPIRVQNRDELIRRKARFRNNNFDPKEYGALGRYQGFTQPWEG